MANTAKIRKSTDEKVVPPTTLGQLLKAQRVKLKKSIEDVSEQLKIRKVFLQAIEEEQFDQLPGGVYTVGFIRSYAQYLGLDHDAIIAQLKEEKFFFPVQLPAVGDEQHFPANRFVSSGMVTAGLFLLLLGAIVAYIFLTSDEPSVHINWSESAVTNSSTDQGAEESSEVNL